MVTLLWHLAHRPVVVLLPKQGVQQSVRVIPRVFGIPVRVFLVAGKKSEGVVNDVSRSL